MSLIKIYVGNFLHTKGYADTGRDLRGVWSLRPRHWTAPGSQRLLSNRLTGRDTRRPAGRGWQHLCQMSVKANAQALFSQSHISYVPSGFPPRRFCSASTESSPPAGCRWSFKPVTSLLTCVPVSEQGWGALLVHSVTHVKTNTCPSDLLHLVEGGASGRIE